MNSLTIALARRFFRAAVFLATLASGSLVVAQDFSWRNIQFGGFLSQGYLLSSHNNYPIETKDGSFDFREMGLNAALPLGSHFRVAAQVFAQRLGPYGDDKPFLDWAVADYNFRPEFGVRVGRLKYPRSLNSDVLDLDIVRPFVLLPQSIYDSRLRDFQASFDGAMLYGSLTTGAGSVDYKVFYGDIPMKTDTGLADFFNTSSLFAVPPGVKQVGIDSVQGASLQWSTPIPGLRVGLYYSWLSHLFVSGQFRAVPTFSSSMDLTKTSYSGVSVDYTKGPWTFSGEYIDNRIKTLLTLPPFAGPPSRGVSGYQSYYLSAARRLGSKFEAGAYFTARQISRAGYSAATLEPARHRDDWAVAIRYDITDHLLFKLEAHAIDGTLDLFNLPSIPNPPKSIEKTMTLFAAKTTLYF